MPVTLLMRPHSSELSVDSTVQRAVMLPEWLLRGL